MDGMGTMLKELRNSMGWTLEGTAEKMGVSKSQYVKLERGERRMTENYIGRAAQVFGVHAADILGEPLSIPLMGYIGAGAEISPDFEQVPDDGFEQVSLPFHLTGDTIAFQVRGDSMYPRFHDGDVVIVWRNQQMRAESYIGLEAAVRTADGRRFIKTIRNGTSGLYLESHNAPPIIGVALVWIGGVAATIPANQIRRFSATRAR
jgi:repressor LexA